MPLPVGPTKATFCPGFIWAEKSFIVASLLPSYVKHTSLNSNFPNTFSGKSTFLVFSSSISSSSRSSNTLSLAAAVCWKEDIVCAIWLSGDVNNLTYEINAMITPKLILLLITSSAPTIQTHT